MFHAADSWLLQRLGVVVPKKQLRNGWPATTKKKQATLNVNLLQVRPHGSTSIARRLPLVFALDYLVIPHGGTNAQRHDLLGRAAIAIAEDELLGFSSDPLPPELHEIAKDWVPYLRLRTTWRHERPADPVPAVTEVEVTRAPRCDVHGVLLDQSGDPLAGEEVTLPTIGRRARSDSNGRIAFVDIPHKPGRTLTVRLRERDWSVRTGKRPFTLQVTPKES